MSALKLWLIPAKKTDNILIDNGQPKVGTLFLISKKKKL